jgi:hypothetical protein
VEDDSDPADERLGPEISNADRLRAIALLLEMKGSNPGMILLDDDIEEIGRAAARERDPNDSLNQLPDFAGEQEPESAAVAAINALTQVYRQYEPATPFQAFQLLEVQDRANAEVGFGSSAVALAFADCIDERVRVDEGEPAVRVTARYTSTQKIEDFIFPANPENWPFCDGSKFFESMRLAPGGYSSAPNGGVAANAANAATAPPERLPLSALNDVWHGGFRARVREVVNFQPVRMVTDLDVVLFVSPPGPVRGLRQDIVDGNKGAQRVGMSFELGASIDGNIDVDHGYLTVTPDPSGGTRIEAMKTVRFTKMTNVAGDWACLLGWLDAMKQLNTCSQ